MTKVGDALVFKSWFISAPLASLLSNLVENEPLSVFNAEILEVTAVILVEKLPLSDFKFETLVENELDALVKELPVASFLATLVEKEDEASVKLPLILVLICAEELYAPSNTP